MIHQLGLQRSINNRYIKEIRALLKMSQKHFEETCHEILKELVELETTVLNMPC